MIWNRTPARRLACLARAHVSLEPLPDAAEAERVLAVLDVVACRSHALPRRVVREEMVLDEPQRAEARAAVAAAAARRRVGERKAEVDGAVRQLRVDVHIASADRIARDREAAPCAAKRGERGRGVVSARPAGATPRAARRPTFQKHAKRRAREAHRPTCTEEGVSPPPLEPLPPPLAAAAPSADAGDDERSCA